MYIFPDYRDISYRGIGVTLVAILLFVHFLSVGVFGAQSGASNSASHAGDAKKIETKGNEPPPPKAEPKVSQSELVRKEIEIKRKEERLQALKADVDNRIEKYEKLLSQLEEALNKVKDLNTEKIKKLVQTYEAMPPEEASVQLSEMEEELAVTILSKMKSKKAGAALALIEPQKAAVLSKKMSRTVNNFPGN
ncbi:MotE family protein [Candidatus Magnetobacterium casense]|uniref:Magnesium transporter MgtE intracellular domain-containing protein n=1 Tax=Candidatus Magnetobacterium casense TaxID=1455061 RepID=A0ABS6RWH0_9BACT|nr:hypothetical protein [Candidatus Magnetobacterium casensis]MBV6340143.1 hypothetical protein [Candidatus Magnetobacterium casensis]